MLTHQRLLEIISFDPETGIAVWRNGARGGKRIGHLLRGSKRSRPYRYWNIKEFGRQKAFSHIVFFYMTGRWPIAEMDHINGDTLDDRWSNLRECTRSQNEANRGPRRSNKTGLKGVVKYDHQDYFRAKIWRGGKQRWLGKFPTAEAAHAAYLAVARTFDGEFFRAA